MRKIAAYNIISGFILLFFIGIVGFFLRIEVVQHYFFSPETPASWRLSLFRSAHAHGSLFALIQIVYGLSIPYSLCKKSSLVFQSIGVGLGAWVMSVLVYFESYSSPALYTWSWNQLCIGVGLGAWMIAITWHGYGLAGRIWQD
jgi:hypothetical protein